MNDEMPLISIDPPIGKLDPPVVDSGSVWLHLDSAGEPYMVARQALPSRDVPAGFSRALSGGITVPLLPPRLYAKRDVVALSEAAGRDALGSWSKSLAAAQTAETFVEKWADLTAWSSTTFAQVSAGRLFAVDGGSNGGNSGANHAFSLAAGETLRAVFNVRTPGNTAAAGGVIVGVSEDAPAAAFTAGAAKVRGVYFRSDGIYPFTAGSQGAQFVAMPSAATNWIVFLTVDESWISVTLRQVGSTSEYRQKWARGSLATGNISVFNSDARGAAGASVGLIGVRKGTVTVEPRTGIEGQVPSVHWTSVGNAGMRIALPLNYDSRIPAPLAILFHGNGSDETHWQSNGLGSSIANALSAAGYIVVGAANTPNVSTWGAQAGLDAYVAAYRFVRDHYAVSGVVVYGNSMGGIETMLTLAERRIPGIVAAALSVPTFSLANNHANTNFTGTIRTAYGIASNGSDYDTKTIGHDPALMQPAAFRGIPIYVVIATDDAAVDPTGNGEALVTRLSDSNPLTVIRATGGHQTSAIATAAPAIVAHFNAALGR